MGSEVSFNSLTERQNMGTKSQVRILVIGPLSFLQNHSEFSEILTQHQTVNITRLAELEKLNPAVELSFQFILVLQSWSDQWMRGDVLQLIQQFPMSYIRCVFGPWCDGDTRNRDIWPLNCRLPWHESKSQLPLLIQQIQTGQADLPLTASREEIAQNYYFSHLDKSEIDQATNKLAVKIVSQDLAYDAMLTDQLKIWNFKVIDSELNHDFATPDVVLFDLDPWTANMQGMYQTYRTQYPASRFILLTGYLSEMDSRLPIHDSSFTEVLWKNAPFSQLVHLLKRISQDSDIIS
jgi:hypothetical protein